MFCLDGSRKIIAFSHHKEGDDSICEPKVVFYDIKKQKEIAIVKNAEMFVANLSIPKMNQFMILFKAD